MGGPRNGKYLNIVIIIGLLLFAVYMVYVHRDVKAQLEASSRTVSSQSTRHEKLTNEFKDLIQAHAQVESQLRLERSKHQKTLSAKTSTEKKYLDDMRELKERCGNEKQRLANERDSFKLQAQEHEDRYEQLSQEHDRLEDQCEDEAETAKENFQKLQAKCQETERQLEVKAQQLSKADKDLQHANFQVRELESAAEAGQSTLGHLQSELKEKEKRIKKMEGELDWLGRVNQQMKEEQREQSQRLQQQQQQLGRPGQLQSDDAKRSVLQDGQRSYGRDSPDKPPGDFVSDTQKRHVFETLRNKLQRGEALTDKQRRIYYLLSKEVASDRSPPQKVGGLPKPSFEIRKPGFPNPSETQHKPGNRPPYPTPAYYKPKFSPPERKVSEEANPGGVGIGPPPPHGDAREGDWPVDKDTNPLKEEEEVKVLKVEEIGNGDEGGANADHEEKFDNLEEEGEEEGEEGGAQLVFDPEKIEEERKKAELEEREPQAGNEGGYVEEEKEEEEEEDLDANINIENLPQPKESQEGRVIEVPPQIKDPIPVPGRDQELNLDRKYDDYDKKYEEDGDEGEYDYKDGGNGAGKAGLPHGLDDEVQRRIMARRDFEGQQQKLVSDHDAHPREEPEFPELAKIVNRPKEQQRREIR